MFIAKPGPQPAFVRLQIPFSILGVTERYAGELSVTSCKSYDIFQVNLQPEAWA